MGLAWCFQGKAQTLQQLLQCAHDWLTYLFVRYLLSLFWDPEIQPLLNPWIIPPAFDHALPFALPPFQHSSSSNVTASWTIPLPLPPTLKKLIILSSGWLFMSVSLESKHKAWHRKEHLISILFSSTSFYLSFSSKPAAPDCMVHSRQVRWSRCVGSIPCLGVYSSRHPIICKRRGRLLIHWQELTEAHSGSPIWCSE